MKQYIFLGFVFTVVLGLISTANAASNVMIISPNSGEVLVIGQPFRVTWNGGGDTVNISRINCSLLLHSDQSSCFPSGDQIAVGIPNTGFYYWIVQRSSSWSNRYRIMIKDTLGGTDMSDKDFIISDYPTLDLRIEPNSGGDTVYTDPTYTDMAHVPRDYPVQIIWEPRNLTSCEASGDWSGSKPAVITVAGTQHLFENIGKISSFTSDKTYTIVCTGPLGTVTKTVRINAKDNPLQPKVSGVSNISISENGTQPYSFIPQNYSSVEQTLYHSTSSTSPATVNNSVNMSTVPSTTVEALQTQINSLLQLIVQLQKQLAAVSGGNSCFRFTRNIRIGDSGEDVKNLASLLSKEGIMDSSDIRYSFDESMASDVVAFQEKYASEILTPKGLKHGTGIVGVATRAKLNYLSCARN